MLINEISVGSDTDVLLNIFTDFLSTKGEKYFEQTSKSKSHYFMSEDKNKQKWYNDECKQNKEMYKKVVCEFNFNKTEINRFNIYEAKRDYKYCCRKTKK